MAVTTKAKTTRLHLTYEKTGEKDKAAADFAKARELGFGR